MKKENRRLAQQRRAEERRKQEKRKKLKRFLSYFIPSVCVLSLAFLIIADAVQNSVKAETTQEEAVSEPSLSADSSLTVSDGDTVNIDYTGTIDGVAFDGGSTNGAGADLVIGSGSYIDDFEDQLIGSHPGDTVEVNVTFPEDYGQEDLNGKDALFEVTVNGIYQ